MLLSSWDEMAQYDLPAMLEFALNISGKDELHYVGHSQGSLMGFAGFPRYPQLAAKVKTFFALAPIAHIKNIDGALKYIAEFYKLGLVRFHSKSFCGLTLP